MLVYTLLDIVPPEGFLGWRKKYNRENIISSTSGTVKILYPYRE
jgi:hypothetical protein